MNNFLCSNNLAKNFNYGKEIIISDLLFQIYSAQLQTLLLLEHRGYPCHPPDKKKLQGKEMPNPKRPVTLLPQVQKEFSFKFSYS